MWENSFRNRKTFVSRVFCATVIPPWNGMTPGLSGQDSLILDTERSIFPTKIIFPSRLDSARVASLAINLYHMCLTLLRDKGSQDDTFLSLLMARSASGVLYPNPTFLPVRWLCAGVSVQTRTNNSYKRILFTLQFNSTPLRKSGSSLVSFIVSDRLASVCTWSVFSTTADSCGFLRWSSTQKVRALTCKHIPHAWDLKDFKERPTREEFRGQLYPQSWFQVLKLKALAALTNFVISKWLKLMIIIIKMNVSPTALWGKF